MNQRRLLTACFTVLLLSTATLRAEVGDPTLRTDHPHYSGEGAFQTPADVVAFATEGKTEPQERAIALFNWLLTHQFHLASPQEWYVAGLVPDTQQTQEDLVVYDANRARFSYAYGLCGTVHSWNEPYWEALGMPARRRAFPGHVNSEIFYGDSWHAFDTDMAGLVFREDGIVAGYEEIASNPDLVQQSRPPLPCYPFAWPGDFEVMKQGWQQIAAGGQWFKLYNSGYAAHPAMVHLRTGETFTRWFDPDHFGGPSKRRFWHHQQNGPFRDWTFVNQGTPRHEEGQSNSRGNASYANGVFVYEPPLDSAALHEGTAAMDGMLTATPDSPKLRSADGGPVSITFHHFSPYVIAADPVDDKNPMSGPATKGLVVSGQSQGEITLKVSVDHGQTWQEVAAVDGAFEQDLTEYVKGRYGWHVRFGWQGTAGLDQLRFETTTQVAQPIYPRLSPDGSQVTYRATSRAVQPLLPNFNLPEAELATIEVQQLRSTNVTYQPRSASNRVAYRVTDNKPGVVVFRLAAPASLLEISGAARYSVRSPSPPDCDFHIDVSTDDGKTWQRLGQAEIPEDNEFSSGWVDGQLDVADSRSSTALVRVHLYGGGYPTGLIDAQVYGIYATTPPQAVTVTYGWSENGQLKTHEEPIPAGRQQHVFDVPTGSDIRDAFVRIAAP